MKALIDRLRAPRTLQVTVLRLLFVRSVGFIAIATAVLVGQGSVRASAAQFDPAPLPIPLWTTADAIANPDCVAAARWPAGELPGSVIVHSFGTHTTKRVDFATAWRLNHNQIDADNLWVLGICR
jgi:hypothetical protein